MLEITLSELVRNPTHYSRAVQEKNEKFLLTIGDQRLVLMSTFDFSMMQTILDIAATVFRDDCTIDCPSEH